MKIDIITYWHRIIGTDDEFELEVRIFHAFSFLASNIVLLNIPLKLLLRLPVTALLAAILFAFMARSYYLSRYKGKTTLGRNVTFAAVYVLLGLNYYYSGGINGPSLLYFVFTYFAIVCIIPRQELLIWTVTHIFLILIMIGTEFFYPEIILYRHLTDIERITDVFSGYLCIMLLFGTSATFLINSYNKERNFTQQQLAVLKVIDQERSKLMAIIGHDLRAPLNNIHSYLQVSNELGLEDNERDEIHNDLIRSTKTTLEFLDNLLFWSKSRMSGIVHSLENHNLKSLIQPQFELLSAVATNKGIQLSYDVDDQAVIYGNNDMIGMIIRNLLDNAIKFTNIGGWVHLDYVVSNNYSLIRVADSGTGIYQKIAADIFEPGHFSTSGTNKEKGFGMGLVLCKEFAEAQKGYLNVQSKPEGGSVFSLKLPVGDNRIS